MNGGRFAALLILAGCAVRPDPPVADPGNSGAVPVRPRSLELFEHAGVEVLDVSRQVLEQRKRIRVERITVHLGDLPGRPGPNVQTLEWYQAPGPGKKPLVLVFSLFGDSLWVDRIAARGFCLGGCNALLVIPTESLIDPERPIAEVNRLLIRQILAARVALDWAARLPDTDPGRISAYGISMGGIRAVTAFGVDPRIRRAGALIAGANLPGIIADTNYGTLRKLRETRMRAEGIPDRNALLVRLAGSMQFDPADFGPLRAPEDLFLVLATNDSFIPDSYQELLVTAYSRPEEGRFPRVFRSRYGHYPTGSSFLRLLPEMVRFFSADGGGAGPGR